VRSRELSAWCGADHFGVGHRLVGAGGDVGLLRAAASSLGAPRPRRPWLAALRASTILSSRGHRVRDPVRAQSADTLGCGTGFTDYFCPYRRGLNVHSSTRPCRPTNGSPGHLPSSGWLNESPLTTYTTILIHSAYTIPQYYCI